MTRDGTTEHDGADGQELAGGLANAGQVRRIGRLVDRPAPAHAATLHAYLNALHDSGFADAPVPVAQVAQGRERLTFIDGHVPLPPFSAEMTTTEVLRSVGALIRRLHDASATIAVDAADWPQDLADPQGGTLLCHNDLCPENVVFRDGLAVGVIDFDLAAPGRPLWDVAMAARYWVPMLDPESALTSYPRGLDVPARLRALADGYGLTAAQRAGLPGIIEQATQRCREFVTARLAAGDELYLRIWRERGGWERWDRLEKWLAENRAAHAAALV